MISTKSVLTTLIILGLILASGIYVITENVFHANERFYKLNASLNELAKYSVQLNLLAADYNLTTSKRALTQAESIVDKLEYKITLTQSMFSLTQLDKQRIDKDIIKIREIIVRLSQPTNDYALKWELLGLTNLSSELFNALEDIQRKISKHNQSEMMLFLKLREVLLLSLIATYFLVAYTFYAMFIRPFKSIQLQLTRLREGDLNVEFEKPRIKEWSVIVDEINRTKESLAKILVSKFDLEKEIEKRKAIQEKSRLAAITDHMTGLPNRRAFVDYLNSEIELANTRSSTFFLLYIDLDNVKSINDNLGHKIGDEVINSVARILKHNSSKLTNVSRIGGDEFAILLHHKSKDKAAYLARTLQVLIRTPMTIEGMKIRVGVSIGIAKFPDDAITQPKLIACADYAMYHAKNHPYLTNNISFYASSMARENKVKFELINQIKEAVDKNEFQVWYQPQVSSADNCINGFEALLRWKNKQGKWISPAEFIPLLEQSSDIISVGYFVIKEAILTRKQLAKHGIDIPISVNVSASQMEQENFIDSITRIFDHYNEKYTSIPLELTETAIFLNKENITHQLTRLTMQGFHLHLDDFGTGNASLDLLKNCDFDAVKIDKSFTDNLLNDPKSIALVDAMSLLSKRLGFSLIIEGVETAKHVSISKTKHIDTMQGYYFSKALPQKQAIEWAINSRSSVLENKD